DREGDLAGFLAVADEMDSFIRTVVAACDYVKGKRRARRAIQLSFDEWNVWRQTRFHADDDVRDPWLEAPSIAEERYDVVDAVVVGSLLITLLSHADRVRIGCLAQLVNVI